MNTKKPTLPPSIERYVVVFAGTLLINAGLLFFLQSQAKTIKLLKEQKVQLEQDQKIINSSEEIYNTYKDDIEEISQVFPSEEDVLIFLQTLEDVSKKYSEDAIARFASASPQAEGDKLFLLFRLTMKTDKENLSKFLKEMESLPYMTRVLTISMSFPDGIEEKISSTINLKLYVKNPFSS